MPTGILLNEEGLKRRECSPADDGISKVSVKSFEFRVSSLKFEVRSCAVAKG